MWHEMNNDLTYQTLKSYEGFKRYGNPDMQFLGTLKKISYSCILDYADTDSDAFSIFRVASDL